MANGETVTVRAWRLTGSRLPVNVTPSYVRMYIFEYDGTFGCSVIVKRREDGLVTLLQTAGSCNFSSSGRYPTGESPKS